MTEAQSVPEYIKERKAIVAQGKTPPLECNAFANPYWLEAVKHDEATGEDTQRHHDRWCYEIHGRRFSHPTQAGAEWMSVQYEKHSFVLEDAS